MDGESQLMMHIILSSQSIQGYDSKNVAFRESKVYVFLIIRWEWVSRLFTFRFLYQGLNDATR